MADGFDSLAVSENPNYVNMKDDEKNLGISEIQVFQVQNNTHVPNFVTSSSAEESIKKEETIGFHKEKSLNMINDTPMIMVGKSCTIDGNGEKRKAEAEEKNERLNVEACDDGCKRKRGEAKRVYCRKELENLRFIGIEEQKKNWVEVYCGLGDTVKKEYDALFQTITSSQKHTRRDRGKRNTPAISGKDHSEHLDDQEGNMETRNTPLDFPVSRDDGISFDEGESDDSDDDYSSIQRPAFMVSGEPDFDSGPPEDGLEYLRRVRWEASKLPKVKIVKVDGSKLNKEQTCYMPQIPDIASCLEHLLPLKEWEEAFLADFSELRQALSRLDANVGTSTQLHSETFVYQEHASNQLPEGIILDKFDGLMSGEDESCLSNAGDDPAAGNSMPKSSPAGGTGNIPTLSVILRMDSVARVSMLRKRIIAVQSMDTLSRDDCLWLFALCAAVDTPLDADTCAALRSLLRKCASLRAEKSKLDDEVIMLNMLATISGRYFGQSEH